MSRRYSSKDRKSLDYIWEKTLILLETKVDSEVMEKWFYNFKISARSQSPIKFTYTGEESIHKFYTDYYDVFKECLFGELGREEEIQIDYKNPKLKKSQEKPVSEKNKKSRKASAADKFGIKKKLFYLFVVCILIAAAAIVITTGVSYISNLGFEETFYQVGSGRIDGNLRIVHLSDLHSTEFGAENSKLIERIEKLDPDIVVMTGDMLESKEAYEDGIVSLCARLAEKVPVYYSYGNNETKLVYDCKMTLEDLDDLTNATEETREDKLYKLKDSFEKSLEGAGAVVLKNEMDTIEINGNTIDVYGILTTNPGAFWEYSKESFGKFIYENENNFKIVLTHEPYIFEEFSEDFWGDLVLAGHTHGGQIILPYFGAVYEKKNGILPEKLASDSYVRGEYKLNNESLIVSRGLTNKGFIRINNKPEVVVIDVNRY